MLWLKRGYFWAMLIAMTGIALLLALPYCLGAVAFCRVKKIDPAWGLRTGVWLYGRVFLFLAQPVMPVCTINPSLALRSSPCIIIPNHQSFLDIYLLATQHCKNLCFVVASWPFTKLFFFAVFMRGARYVKVGHSEDSSGFVARCKEELQAGATIVCFPEGTRSKTGRLSPFQSGIFRLAAATGAKLVPMVFYNTGEFCPPGSFRVNPQKIFVKLLEPIQCEDMPTPKQAHKKLMRQAHEAMLAELNTNTRSAK